MTEQYINNKNNRLLILMPTFISAIIILIVAAKFYILNTSNEIFTVAANNIYAGTKANIGASGYLNINYNLNAKINSAEEKYQDMSDIVNNINITGLASLDKQNDLLSQHLIVNYHNQELLNTNLLLKNDSIYLNSHDLLDMPIEIKSILNSYNYSIKDYEQVQKSIFNSLNYALKKAKYKSQIVKLDDKKVKNTILNIDASLLDNILSKLLQDNKFLTSLSNIISKDIPDTVSLLEDIKTKLIIDNYNISIYTSLIKNEFIKLSLSNNRNDILITKENNKYNFKIHKDNKIKYQGYILYSKVSDSMGIIINLSLNKKTSISVNFTCSVAKNYNETFDTATTINYNQLTRKQRDEIISNLSQKDAIASLSQYLGITDLNVLLPSQI